MDKKEVFEIRKLMKAEQSVFTKIRGCYVSAADKRIISKNKDAFLSLPETEETKYLEICKKALSGKLEKVLYNVEFPVKEEQEGGAQKLLYELWKCGLKNDQLLDEFYNRVIQCYQCKENYYIIMMYGVYDIPGKSSDDASDESFPFIQCCICPVALSDASLGYQETKQRIGDCTRDWVVGMPENGFLFPLFNDRSADIHGVLYYCKNEKGLTDGLIDNFLKCVQPMSAKAQKETFTAMVEEAFGDKCEMQTVVNIQESLEELEDEQKLSSEMAKEIFESCGAEKDALKNLDGLETEIAVSNISEAGCKIKADNVTIQIDLNTALQMEEKMIHRRRCLIVPLEGEVKINGIAVTMRRK